MIEENSNFVENFIPLKTVRASAAINIISFSFVKGDLSNFITVSGLVGPHPPQETRFSFKKETNKLNSSCNCKQWTKEEHCVHVAALINKYLKQQNAPVTNTTTSLEEGVHCKDYGTIIDSPSKLAGIQNYGTFFSLQYRLTNGKLVNLEIPQNLKHKIIFNIKAQIVSNIDLENYDKKLFHPTFSFIDHEDKLHEKVSIIDHLYLFDWETGIIYDLPFEIKNLLKKLKMSRSLHTIEEYIRLTQPLKESEQFIFKIEDLPFNSIELNDVQLRWSITKSHKKNHLSLCLEMYDPITDKLIKFPDYFQLFLFDNGFLNYFNTKHDAGQFLNELLTPQDTNLFSYKKYLRFVEKRDFLTDLTEFMVSSSHLPIHDDETGKWYKLESKDLFNLFKSGLDCFTDQFFKFSTYQIVERKIYFEIPRNILFTGMNNFYMRMVPLGVHIFYNKKEVKTWQSKIRFERKNSAINWFDLTIHVSDEDYEVIKDIELDQDFTLSKDGLVLLNDEQRELIKLVKKYTQHESTEVQINTNDLSKKFKISFNKARIFELFELKKLGIEGALSQEEIDFCEKLLNLDSIPEYPVSKKVQDIARPYQIVGYRWLRFLYENNLGACLADDMGLGKTLQTIIFLESIIESVKKVLIVCPVSIILNWQNEIKKFSDLNVDVFYGDSRELKPESKIILTSYGLMKKEAYEQLSQYDFDILILDEVQNLKNIRSLGANAARNLKAKFRICLTGTPVENDLSEFYNIIDLSIPGIWGDLHFIKTSSNKKSRLLAKKLVRPFVLRRTKAQVLPDLPEKIENHVYLEMSEEEKNKYTAHLLNIKNRLALTTNVKKYGEILKGLLELRQLCLWQHSPQLVSTKVDFLLENLELILGEGHQALVFSQFTTYLDIIEAKVIEKAWNFSRIDGTQTFKTRQTQVDKFQSGKSKVFLISLKAGGVGLNLTAASYIFLMDPWWNPAVENQAIDRAHRIGQKNKLTVYRPIVKDSVEEKVLILQQAKKELFNDLLSTDESTIFSGRLTQDDFQALLS